MSIKAIAFLLFLLLILCVKEWLQCGDTTGQPCVEDDKIINNHGVLPADTAYASPTGAASDENAGALQWSGNATAHVAVLSFVASEDATIAQDYPSVNYGAEAQLIADDDPRMDFLLKFNVMGTRAVTKAILKLYGVAHGPAGAKVYHAKHNRWLEKSVTWLSAPWVNRPELATLPAIVADTSYDVDLTSMVKADGIYSLRIVQPKNGSVRFSSAQGLVKPTLILSATGQGNATNEPMNRDAEMRCSALVTHCLLGHFVFYTIFTAITTLLMALVFGVRTYQRRKQKSRATGSLSSSNSASSNVESASKDFYAIDSSHVTVLKDSRLGSGGFASVYKGLCKTDVLRKLAVDASHSSAIESRDALTDVAVKIAHAHMPKSVSEDVIREIEIMKELSQNEHILRLLAIVAPHNSVPILLLEYCAYGNLQSFLRTRMTNAKLVDAADCSSLSAVTYENTDIRIRDLISFCWQASDGMTYVASKGFVHRDLAARNVLVTDSLMVKIADFGLCRYSDESVYIAHLESKLPIKWMALESLKKAEFTTKTDVWSFGVLLYEIFSAGATPYNDQHPTELSGFLASGNRLEQPQLCPTEVHNLMRECWLEDPNDRPFFEQIRKRCAKWLELFAEDYGYCQAVPDEPQKFADVCPALMPKAS